MKRKSYRYKITCIEPLALIKEKDVMSPIIALSAKINDNRYGERVVAIAMYCTVEKFRKFEKDEKRAKRELNLLEP